MAGRILVVDDVATNRIILKAKLGIACYDVLQAEDGKTALALARSERPDLILLDLAMPGMSGLDVLKVLKKAPETADIPVVVISSQTDLRSRLAVFEAGAEDYLTKPIDDLHLAALVRSLLRTRVLADELQLRDVTRRALGFSEAQTPFASPPVVGPGAQSRAAAQPSPAMAHAEHRPSDGRVAVIDLGGSDTQAIFGAARLLGRGFEWLSPADAMRLARGTPIAAQNPSRRPGPHIGAPGETEVFVIMAGHAHAHEAMMLLSELRAGHGTSRAAIVMAVPAEASPKAAIALDLGAADVLSMPWTEQEVALRLSRQITRVRSIERARRRLRDGLQMAVTDPLTGLPNRRYGLSYLERALERAMERDTGLSVVMLDLDRFKTVNDLHGHAAGDQVLREVAARLQPQLRSGDLLTRIGGEEFLVVLPDIPESDARKMAERLRQAMDTTPVSLPIASAPGAAKAQTGVPDAACPTHLILSQTVSVGLASGPLRGELDLARRSGLSVAAAALMERADAALMRAKTQGRNCVVTCAQRRNGEAAA
ncbi:MAG: diguanylate cyclase [Pseudomonadota bacterium]